MIAISNNTIPIIFYLRYLITLQGLPPAIQLAGISVTTTLPAAMTLFSPIVTPLRIILLAPINT